MKVRRGKEDRTQLAHVAVADRLLSFCYYALRESGTAGRRHLEYVLKEFVEHYQEARPHEGLDHRTPSGQPAVTPLAVGRIVRQDPLGGPIHEYDRAAA